MNTRLNPDRFCPCCPGVRLNRHAVYYKDQTIEADRCPRCNGMWFDAGELERVLDVASQQLRAPKHSRDSDRRCPVDGTLMAKFHYPQTLVEVDVCRECHGLWLDHDELKEIAAVRRSLKVRGTLETQPPPDGIKGALLTFIDSAIASLSKSG